MRFERDPDVNALHIRMASRDVAQTVEIEVQVLADLDPSGEAVGFELGNADKFVTFLRKHGADEALPPRSREVLSLTSA